VVAEDLLEFLGRAITCAILGKAGPQRSRVLGMLFKVSLYNQLVCIIAEAAVVLLAALEPLLVHSSSETSTVLGR
jgi:hypothetical protein